MEIMYCNSGPPTLRDERRQTAYRKMAGTCPDGRYEIVSEDDAKGAYCPLQRTIRYRCVGSTTS